MKYPFLILIFSIVSAGSFAHAFLSSEDQVQFLAAMNKINPAKVQFQDVRCSARSRMCLVRMELGAKRTAVGCAIEQIASSDDLFVSSAAGLQLSPYSQSVLNQCLEGFVR